MNTTGSSNATIVIGGNACPDCGERHQVTTEFHGRWTTLCVACGAEQ